MPTSKYNIPKTAIDVTCKSGNEYKVFMSLDEPMMYNVKTEDLEICTETNTDDSIECMMKYYNINEKTARSYLTDGSEPVATRVDLKKP